MPALQFLGLFLACGTTLALRSRGPVESVFKHGDVVCGSAKIKGLITGDASTGHIRNVPWEKVDHISQSFVSSKQTEIQTLEGRMNSLNEELAKAQQRENSRQQMTAEQYGEIMQEAVTEAYGSVEKAKTSKCGANPRALPRAERPPAGAMEQATEKLEAILQARSAEAESARAVKSNLAEACFAAYVPADEDSDSTWCDELCNLFADQVHPGEAAPVGGRSSDKVTEDMDDVKTRLDLAKVAKTECEAWTHNMDAFKTQLQAEAAAVTQRFSAIRSAKHALLATEYDLEENEEMLGRQTQAMEGMNAAVAQLRSESEALHDTFSHLKAAQADLAGSLKKVSSQVTASEARLTTVHRAAEAVGTLKQDLTALLMEVSLSFDEAVRAPLRALHLDATAIPAAFPAGPSASAACTKAAVQQLHHTCSEDAHSYLGHFASESNIAADEFCNFGTADKVSEQISGAVSHRGKSLKDSLLLVASWLNIFKGSQDMNEAKAAELVAGGELQGLREAIAILAQTEFYSKYLKQWKTANKRKPGKLFKAFHDLQEALQHAFDQHSSLSEEFKQITAKFADVSAKRDQVSTELSAVLEKKGVAAGHLKQARNALRALEAQKAELEAEQRKHAESSAKAKAEYQAALTKLQDTHASGTAFMELIFGDTHATIKPHQ